ncbi:MAG: DNA replication/repair protein RecF [Clostridia bacterium]|nr:DNA replication/repair protein RecF [Clostridia bacterium]
MRIEQIELKNFRNYREADIRPCEGITIFLGDNAQGKTNILESVYLCCTGRSHRTSHDRELIRGGEEAAGVHIRCQRADGSHDVEIRLSQTERRTVKVAGQPVSRSGELMGHVTGVLFSPEDLRMVKDGPQERRRFIDMELSQLKPAYYYALQRYNRALKQRNLLLKQVFDHPGLSDTLLPWEEQLASAGAQIMAARRKFIAGLNGTAAETHAHVSGGREQLSVLYQPALMTEAGDEQLKDALLHAYHVARAQDLRRMTTTVGPHRDDVKLLVNGLDVRTYGSQGQQRTTALSLKLSELEVMRDELGEWPVLMLDDVMSELDPERRRHLLSRLEGVQTLVTCTDRDDLAGARTGRVYRVHEARLTAEED